MLCKAATLILAAIGGYLLTQPGLAQSGGSFIIGPNDRPARLLLPEAALDKEEGVPLLLFLHGYGTNSSSMDRFLGLSRQQNQLGYALLLADGLIDESQRQFWNATPFCCDFGNTDVDDSTYLRGLIETALEAFPIDPARVMVWGYSNGGFMAYRMACDHSELISGIVNITGAMFLDPSQCQADHPVSVLHIHGTNDEVINYFGFDQEQPGAERSVRPWAGFNSCRSEEWSLGEKNVVSASPFLDETKKNETDVLRFTDCQNDASVSLWRVNGSGHTIYFRPSWIALSLQELEN